MPNEGPALATKEEGGVVKMIMIVYMGGGDQKSMCPNFPFFGDSYSISRRKMG